MTGLNVLSVVAYGFTLVPLWAGWLLVANWVSVETGLHVPSTITLVGGGWLIITVLVESHRRGVGQ